MLWRRFLWRVAAVIAAGLAWLGFEAARIEARSAPFVRDRPSALPETRVALVLGCSPRVAGGRSNQFFVARMAAAAELYHAGRASYLLLSGDNSHPSYDEPTAMKRALEARGVPSARLVLDYAGFRTLDSVVRAKEVFGVTRLIVVSQHFHNVRAVYLARAHGIEAYGFDAAEVTGVGGAWPKLREVASRVFAVLDVHVLRTEPRFGGPLQPMPSG
jgi:SanA protein